MRIAVNVESIKRLLQAAGMTQAEMSERLEISNATGSLKINGQRQWRPSQLARLRKLLKEDYGVTISAKALQRFADLAFLHGEKG